MATTPSGAAGGGNGGGGGRTSYGGGSAGSFAGGAESIRGGVGSVRGGVGSIDSPPPAPQVLNQEARSAAALARAVISSPSKSSHRWASPLGGVE